MKYLALTILFLTSGLLAQDQPASMKITLQDGQEMHGIQVSETDSTLTIKNFDGEISTIRKDDILQRDDITIYVVVTSALEPVPPNDAQQGVPYSLAEALRMENYEHLKNPWQAKVGFGDGVLMSLTRSFEINVLKNVGLRPTATLGMLSLQHRWIRRDNMGNVRDSAFVSHKVDPFVMVGLDWIKKKGPSHLTLKFGIGGRATPPEIRTNTPNVPFATLGMELGHGPYSLEIQSFYSLNTSSSVKYSANIYSIGYTSWHPFETIKIPALAFLGASLLKMIRTRL